MTPAKSAVHPKLQNLTRFWSNVEKTDGCWNWTGYIRADGYGSYSFAAGIVRPAHRIAYELLVAAVPAQLQLDHLCRNRQCVNPCHLEPVTPRENTLRSPVAPAAINARKTHCIEGHELGGPNLYTAPNGTRHCRRCRADAVARYRSRRRAA